MTDLKALADEQHGVVRRLANTLIESGFTLQAPCPFHSALRFRGMGDVAIGQLTRMGLVAQRKEVDYLVPVLAAASRHIGVQARGDLEARWVSHELRWDSARRRVMYRNCPLESISRRRLAEWLAWAGITLPAEGDDAPKTRPAAEIRRMLSVIHAHVAAGGAVDSATAQLLCGINASLAARTKNL